MKNTRKTKEKISQLLYAVEFCNKYYGFEKQVEKVNEILNKDILSSDDFETLDEINELAQGNLIAISSDAKSLMYKLDNEYNHYDE